MSVFKVRQCLTCGRKTEVQKVPKKSPPCDKCGGETVFSDKWYVQIRMPDGHGRTRKVRRAVSTNKQFAIEYEGKQLGKRGDGEFFEKKETVPFASLADEFLIDCQRRVNEGNLSPKTESFYRQMFTSCLIPWFGERDAKKITTEDIEAFKEERSGAARKVRIGDGKIKDLKVAVRPATVNRNLSALSALFTFGIKRKRVKENPCAHVERLREDNKRDRFLSKEEISRLLSECKTDHLRLAVLVSLEAGLRLEGCITLRWSEIDFERNEIVKICKGRKEVRVPLTRKLRDALLDHQKRQKEAILLNPDLTFEEKSKIVKAGLVIPSPVNPLKPMRVDANFGFETACRRAGISDITFHDLRRTFATHFIVATGDIHTLACILGHSTTHVTERYAHMLDDHKRELMKKFESQ